MTAMTAIRDVTDRIARFVKIVSGCHRGVSAVNVISAGHSRDPRA